jgi:CheY-like chemotaxis protein
VKSALGKGTRVTFCLPRGEGVQQAAAAEERLALGAGTVLLVEDNPDVATASAGFLEELGYRVKWATDADAAIREIEQNVITVVFSDMVMPGKMDGIGLARHLKESHPDLPVLLATGYSEAAQKFNSEFPILRKPYQLHELSRALQDILGT